MVLAVTMAHISSLDEDIPHFTRHPVDGINVDVFECDVVVVLEVKEEISSE